MRTISIKDHISATKNFLGLLVHGELSEIERLELFRRYGFRGKSRALYEEWRGYAAIGEDHPRYTLEALLSHAVRTVPFYRNTDPGDLQNFPVLGKSDMQKDPRGFVSSAYPLKRLRYFTTAGSTGMPFGFYYQPELDTIRDAFFSAMWQGQGYRDYERSAVLRGLPVQGGGAGRVAARYDYFNNELLISAYNLSWESLAEVAALIRMFEPETLKCYPSMGALLAKYLAARNETLPLKRIFCGSENLYPWQIELMERTLKGRVFSWYGHSENAVLAALTPARDGYRVFSNYGVAELVDEKGVPIKQAGIVGEIVATSLINYGMPFIRYRTADRACWLESPENIRHPKLSLIEGRLQELFIGKIGNIMSMTAINMHSPDFDDISQFQFTQEEPGRLLMKIVPLKEKDSVSLARIEYALREKTGASIDYSFEIVREIPLPRNGKHRFLIQKLDINGYLANKDKGTNQ